MNNVVIFSCLFVRISNLYWVLKKIDTHTVKNFIYKIIKDLKVLVAKQTKQLIFLENTREEC